MFRLFVYTFFRCGNACWSIRCNLSTPAFSPSHHWLGRSILCCNSSSYHLTSCSSSILLSFHTLIYQFFPMCRVFETLFCCSYPHTSVNTTWHQLIHPLQYAYFPPKKTSLTSICPVLVHKVGHQKKMHGLSHFSSILNLTSRHAISDLCSMNVWKIRANSVHPKVCIEWQATTPPKSPLPLCCWLGTCASAELA